MNNGAAEPGRAILFCTVSAGLLNARRLAESAGGKKLLAGEPRRVVRGEE
jgi:hypothetical protein